MFEEKVSNTLTRTKFTVPQVKEGTIIEYSYKIQSDFYYHVDTWFAQEEIPTILAEFRLNIPRWFITKVSSRGIDHLIGERKDMPFFLKNGYRTDGNEFTFVGYNLPALKGDSYIYNVDDYRAQVNTDISGITIPGSVYRDFSSTWDEIDVTLREDDDFKVCMRSSSPWKKEIVEAGIDKVESVSERIELLLKMLHSRVKWDGRYNLFGRSLSSVAKSGEGSSSEMNSLFMAMLRDAGVKSSPVVMSLRSHRRIVEGLPSLNSLNAFIAAVHDGTRVVYVDASCAEGGMNNLPSVVQTNKARLIPDQGAGQWVDLSNLQRNLEFTTINAHFDSDGAIKASVVTQGTGNVAASMRRNYKDAENNDSYVKKLDLGDRTTVDEVKFDGADTHANSVKRTMELTMAGSGETADIIYINPMIIPQITKNPFKDEKRKLPIEMPYANTVKQIVNIEIPEGYEVEGLPKPVKAVTSNGDISLVVGTKVVGNMINTMFTLEVKTPFFIPVSYPEIREIFEMAVSHNSENVVLRKIKK
ncbi:MAG: hypothetical protein IKR18_03575 [Bacteroidaceae bacterium]|nr:hypothetical protein [Bacteroidaceae bacterium]